MAEAGAFLAAVAATLGVTLLAVLVLRRPMGTLLAELCGSRQRGECWTALGAVCMLLAAPAASMLPDAHLRRPVASAEALLLNAVVQCVFGLAGVLGSLFIVGGALYFFIRRFEVCARGTAAARAEAASWPPERAARVGAAELGGATGRR